MKTYLLAALVGAPVLLVLCHCQGISSFEQDPGPRGEGAVYYLPKTEYQVKFTVAKSLEELPGTPPLKKGETVSVDIACEPVFVADRSESYRLHSSANELFDREHHITVQNGLLTTAGIKDDGRLLEIVKLLGDSASMVISAQANPLVAAAKAVPAAANNPADFTRLQSNSIKSNSLQSKLFFDAPVEDQKEKGGLLELAKKLEADLSGVPLVLPSLPPFPTPDFLPELGKGSIVPTGDEVRMMMLQLAPGTHQWQFNGSKEDIPLPGASGRIHATFEPDRQSSKDSGNSLSGLDVAKHCGNIRGVVAKNTTKAGVTVAIEAEEGMVSQIRLVTARKNLELFTKYIDAVQEQVDIHTTKGRKLLEEILANPDGFKQTSLGKFPVEDKKEEYKKIAKARIHMVKLVAKAAPEKQLYTDQETQYSGTTASNRRITLKKNMLTVQRTIDDKAIIIPLTRGPIGESSHTLTLTQGTMGDWSFKKKSAVEGLIQIPIELAKDIIGIPAAAVGIQTEGTAAQTELVKAQTELATAQAELLKKQAELEEARNPTDEE